jgi:hypothetical protein
LPVFADSQIGGTPYLSIATPGSGQTINHFTMTGSGGGCVTHSTAVAVVSLAGTVVLNPIVTRVGTGCTGAETFTLTGAGGTAATFTASFPYLTYTDPASQLAGLQATDDANGVLGANYSDNTPPSVGTVTVGPYGFFDPIQTNPALGSIPDSSTASGNMTLSPGITYQFGATQNIPSGFTLKGPCSYSDGVCTIAEPSSAFALPTYSTTAPFTALLNLGPPLGTTTAFALGSSVENLSINCLAVPGMAGVSNLYAQQGSHFKNLVFHSCPYSVYVGSVGGPGGSQNWDGIYNIGTSPFMPPTSPGIDAAIVTTGGSYTQAPVVTVTGCTRSPSLAAGGTFPGPVSYVYGVAPNYYGYGCPSSGATISFDTTYGSGAAATPIQDMQPMTTAIYLASAAGTTFLQGNSVVGSSNQAFAPPYAYDFENSGNVAFHNYGESVQAVMGIAETSTGGTHANVVFGVSGQGSGWPVLDVVDLGTAAGGSNGFVGGGISGGIWPLCDLNPGAGACIPGWAGHVIGGNQDSVSFYARSGANKVLSLEPWIVTNIPIGVTDYNYSSSAPQPWLPLTKVGGDLTTIPASSVDIPVGIGSNGSIAAGSTNQFTAVHVGKVPVIFDAAPTIGNYAQLSAAACVGTAVCAHDSGFSPTNPPTTNITTIGIVADDGTYGSAVALTPTIAPTCTVAAGTPAGVSYTFGFTQHTYADGTLSPMTTVTVSNGPAFISPNSYITCTGLPAVPLIVTVQAVGIVVPTITGIVGPDGTMAGATVGTSNGWTFAPNTLTFTGGSCSTEPAGTALVYEGFIAGVHWTNRGVGCLTSPTATPSYTNNGALGVIGFTQGSTTFKYWGQKATKNYNGVTLSTGFAGWIAPNVDFGVIQWPGSTGTGNVTASGTFTVGHILAAANTGGTSVIDGGAPAIAATNTFNGGDVICAHGGDTTVGSEAIVGGTANSLTLSTIQSIYVLPGTQLGVTGATPSGLNGGPYTVLSRFGNVITFNANLPATWTSGGTAYLWCSNSADAIGTAAYATNNAYTISSLVAGSSYSQKYQLQYWTPTGAQLAYFWQEYGGTVVYKNSSTQALLASASGRLGSVWFTDSAPTSAWMLSTMDLAALGTSTPNYTSGLTSPIPAASSGALEMGLYFSANGLGSVTSASGGTISSITAGQTCTLGTFNDSLTNGSVTVTFANNASWSGATFTVTNTGYGATVAPTSASLSSGTGTCSGTPTLVTVLGGAQGTAIAVTSARTAQ